MDDARQRLTEAGIVFERVEPDSAEARACLTRYYAELAVRFEGGFDEAGELPTDADDMRPPRGAFLVASVDGTPVACSAVKTFVPGVGYIKRMWVDEAMRGTGLGRRMLDAIETQAGELGFTTVVLETNRALTEAINLYRHAGYTEVAPFNDERYAHHWFEKRLRRAGGVRP
ncbi:MAG TPA: GNAT family N-acetyltransferase [Gemmatimonadaceae bacterium]|nr:GNAT family N-acetyltransferase [Gemmatimonadaceae bacterium]